MRKNRLPNVPATVMEDNLPAELSPAMMVAWRKQCGLTKAKAARLLGLARGSYRKMEAQGTTMRRTILALRAIHGHLHLSRLHYYESEGRLHATPESTEPE